VSMDSSPDASKGEIFSALTQDFADMIITSKFSRGHICPNDTGLELKHSERSKIVFITYCIRILAG
jgi:hypothetical protein